MKKIPEMGYGIHSAENVRNIKFAEQINIQMLFGVPEVLKKMKKYKNIATIH